MADPHAARTKIFISYSHKDRKWLDRLQVHLKPLERKGLIDFWDDTDIASGQNWHNEINKAMAEAKVAVLLTSADFLASDFIAHDELPILLKAQEDGLVVLPINLSPYNRDAFQELSQIQAVNPPSRLIIDLSLGDSERVWKAVTERILEVLGIVPAPVRVGRPPAPAAPASTPPLPPQEPIQRSPRIERLLAFLVDKRTSVRVSIGVLCFWFLLGALDYYAFPTGSTITWLTDVMGHWLISFMVITSFTLYMARAKLEDLAATLHEDIEHLASRHIVRVAVAAAFLCLVFTVLNTLYVTDAQVVHWTKNAGGWVLPGFVALVYFTGIFFLFLATMYYAMALYVIAQRPEEIKYFNPWHPDQRFGLTRLSTPILWYTVVVILMQVPALLIQIIQKGEPTPSAFLTPVLFLAVIYMIFINPLWMIYRRLDTQKADLEAATTYAVKTLETQLNGCPDPDCTNMIKDMLEEASERQAFVAGLKTVPLSTSAFVAGSITLLTIVAELVFLIIYP